MSEKLPKVRKLLILPLLIVMCWACAPSEQELYDAGIKELQSGNYTEAISYFDKVIAKNSENTAAHNARGVAFFELEKWDEAIAAFQISMEIDSTSYKPYLNLGNAFLEKKEFKNAVKNYNMASSLDPNQTDIYYNRGLALLGMEQYEDAILDFDMALQVDPNQVLVHFNRAKALLGNNNPLEAINALEKAVALDDQNGPAFYLLGVTQMSALGKKEEGCMHLKRALSLGYTDAKEWIDEFCDTDS